MSDQQQQQLSQENIAQENVAQDKPVSPSLLKKSSPVSQQRSESPSRAAAETSKSQHQESQQQQHQKSPGQQRSKDVAPISPKNVHEETIPSSHQEACRKLDDYYTLIKGYKTCMITTKRQDGSLNARMIRCQKRKQISDLWFVCNHDSTLEDIEHDNQVSISYYQDGTNKWVSINGTARITKDHDQIRTAYSSEWKGLFDNLHDNVHDLTVNDPRFILIFVDVHNVTYSKPEETSYSKVMSNVFDKVKKPFETSHHH
eukprot:gene9170-10761_t